MGQWDQRWKTPPWPPLTGSVVTCGQQMVSRLIVKVGGSMFQKEGKAFVFDVLGAESIHNPEVSLFLLRKPWRVKGAMRVKESLGLMLGAGYTYGVRISTGHQACADHHSVWQTTASASFLYSEIHGPCDVGWRIRFENEQDWAVSRCPRRGNRGHCHIAITYHTLSPHWTARVSSGF